MRGDTPTIDGADSFPQAPPIRLKATGLTQRSSVLREFPRVVALGLPLLQRLLDRWCQLPVANTCGVMAVQAVACEKSIDLVFTVQVPPRIIKIPFVYIPMRDLLCFIIRSGFHDFTSHQELLRPLGTSRWQADRWQVHPLPPEPEGVSQMSFRSAWLMVNGQELHLPGPVMGRIRPLPREGSCLIDLTAVPWSAGLASYAARGYLVLAMERGNTCLRQAAVESVHHQPGSSWCDVQVRVSDEVDGPFTTERLTVKSFDGPRLRLDRGRHTSRIDVRAGTVTIGLIQPGARLDPMAAYPGACEVTFHRTSDPVFQGRRVAQARLVAIRSDLGWAHASCAELEFGLNPTSLIDGV